MNISTAGILKLQQLEGISLKPYRDAGGLWTIGIGHLIKPGEENLMKGITDEQAHTLFVKDLVPFVQRVNRYINVDLTQNQFDALVAWDFNTGRIHNSTLAEYSFAEMINNRESMQRIFQWWSSNYIKAGGKVIPGLVKRRNIEAAMFTGLVPAPGSGPVGNVLRVAIGAGLLYALYKHGSRSR